MVVDSWENSIAIREKIRQKYRQILWIYTLDVLISFTGYVLLCYVFREKGECPFHGFLAFLVLGEFFIAGVIGFIQFFAHKRKRNYSVEKIGTINIIFWLLYAVFIVTLYIRPQKIMMFVLGIILSIILDLMIFFFFILLYHKVNVFSELYSSCEQLEKSISDYGGIELYNQYADLYNQMNDEIKNLGQILESKDVKKKYIKQRIVMEDLEDMLKKIPKLDILDIRIYSGRLECGYRIRAYIKFINRFSNDVDKMLGKAEQQIINIKSQIDKKGELLNAMNEAVEKVQRDAGLAYISNREINLRESIDNMRESHKKLTRKSRMERKIKSVKRGIFK